MLFREPGFKVRLDTPNGPQGRANSRDPFGKSS